MRILAVGGGSGGHVTPTLAVLREIRKVHPRAEIRFWCDRKFIRQAREMVNSSDKDILLQTIIAGKFRRYHHLSVMQHIMWPSLMLKNFGDSFLVLFGLIQSLVKLVIWRPDVVFTKGGYVCLPVGLVAHFLRIPLVIHDSDAHPGLTNRVLSRFADTIATGAPLDYYPYPRAKTHYIGIPISDNFKEFSESDKRKARASWNIDEDKPLLVVTGGGLGATRINDTVVKQLSELLKFTSVILVSGNAQYDELKSLVPQNNARFQLYAFVPQNMSELLGMADVVAARAGATTILELAALSKPTILIPNAKLTGGHQLKNAAVYKDADAVDIVNEDDMVQDPQIFTAAVKSLLQDSSKMSQMARKFHAFAKPNAAKEMAKLILDKVK